MDVTFEFDWRRPPLNENDRDHWRARAERVKSTRLAARLASGRYRGQGRVEVWLTWVVRDHRKRDEDNIVPTLKALCDGLVDAGVVEDDTPRFMVKHMPRIRVEPGALPHLELRVKSVGASR